jgi:hypothetical protein
VDEYNPMWDAETKLKTSFYCTKEKPLTKEIEKEYLESLHPDAIKLQDEPGEDGAWLFQCPHCGHTFWDYAKEGRL